MIRGECAEEEYIWSMKNRTKIQGVIPPEEEDADPFAKRLMLKRNLSLQSYYDPTQIMASLVPDEIIYNVDDYSHREYDVCLLFGDVSGFTELCEKYNITGKGGPSRLTTVLNAYLGAMVQEVMSYGGDVLKFSGDAFLAMWKCGERSSMRDYVHDALDCALVIQKSYGTYETDVGVLLRAKLAISAGRAIFSLIGNQNASHYVVVGQPILDVKEAEHKSSPGEIIVSPSAWYHVNISEYLYSELDDGVHVKIYGVGLNWRHVQKPVRYTHPLEGDNVSNLSAVSSTTTLDTGRLNDEIALRPSFNHAVFIKENLRKFIIPPLMKCIDSNEPLEYLTEMRHVVIILCNVIIQKTEIHTFVNIIDEAYKIIYRNAHLYKGCMNKVSLFDKDLMFIVIFGLRGFKHTLECQQALKCSSEIYREVQKIKGVKSISIAVTTGKTYCGIVGHTLRKEYTVIGIAVNKGARMMVVYPDRVTCDRQTFQHSKMEAKHFILQDYQTLKGISRPGPIYQFKEVVDPDDTSMKIRRYPILGRDDELQLYLTLMTKFLECVKAKVPESPKKSVILISGSARQGKTRLLDEFIYKTPTDVPVHRIVPRGRDKNDAFSTIRLVLSTPLGFTADTIGIEKMYKIRKRLSFVEDLVLPYLCVLNSIFNIDFKETSRYSSLNEQEREILFIKILTQLCYASFVTPWIVAIDNIENVDEVSCKYLPLLWELNVCFMIVTLNSSKTISTALVETLKHKKIHVLKLENIDELYHAGLACQMLQVYAIPPDLENVIQSNSNGNPGWIESFLVNLVQSRGLVIKRVNHHDVHMHGLVAPPLYMMYRLTPEQTKKWRQLMEEKNQSKYNDSRDPWHVYVDSCRDSYTNITLRGQIDKSIMDDKYVTICLISPFYNITDVDAELSKDIDILRVFDSLTYYEQLVLKSSSVLGDTFPREMLVFIMSAGNPMEIALAIQTLFEIRVFCCAKGDFTEGGQYVISREKMVDPIKDNSIRCDCEGLHIEEPFDQLPKYASCGFLRFRSSYFRETTYNLLTDAQKKEFHSRAVKYLFNETRKCHACGLGYFNFMWMDKTDNNMSKHIKAKRRRYKSAKHKDLDEMFTDLNRSLTISSSNISGSSTRRTAAMNRGDALTLKDTENKVNAYDYQMGIIGPQTLYSLKDSFSLVMSYSSYDFANCECNLILTAMWRKTIKHCKGSGRWLLMIEAMNNYSRACIAIENFTESRNIMKQALDFIQTSGDQIGVPHWQIPLIEASCLTLYAVTLLKLGQENEALENLYLAMEKFGYPFPKKAYSLSTTLVTNRLRQKLGLYILPDSFVNRKIDKGKASVLDNMSECLTWMCRIFTKKEMLKKAELAAIWGLKRALESQTNFSRICNAFNVMITIAQKQKKKFLCLALEVHALRYCHKKRDALDVEDLRAVGHMYYKIFYSRVIRGELDKALHIGYIIIRISISTNDFVLTSMILPVVIQNLISKKYLHEATALINELEYYSSEISDNSGKAWYYNVCMVFHLETGYTVVPIEQCQMYYQGEGVGMPGVRNLEAKKRFVICMWLYYLRNEEWEAAAMWERQVEYYFYSMGYEEIMAHSRSLLIMLEAVLLFLVHKINKRNISEIILWKKKAKHFTKVCKEISNFAVVFRPRYHLLKAYYMLILNEEESNIKNVLQKGKREAEIAENFLEHQRLEHMEKAWEDKLPSTILNFWKVHCSPDNLLTSNEIELSKIGFFTFPAPLYV